MNISLKNIDAVSVLLKVEIEKNDYAESLDKSLRKMRQQARIPGFRPGMTPLGYIKKMYGKQAMAEEVNKLVTNGLYSYLKENQVNVLGDPIPNETEQKKIDFDIDENFEFCFDIALKPEIMAQLSKDDTLMSYRIMIDDETVDKQVDSYRKQYGTHEMADTVVAEDLVKGKIIELEAGVPKTDGIVIEDAVLMPAYMKGKMEQKKFIGAKNGKTIIFNPYKTYKGAEAEIASFLKIEKDEVKNMKSDFSFEIKEITRYNPAELNPEFFDKILGPEAAKDETEFREKIKESISTQYASYVEIILKRNMRDMLIQKTDDVVFADDILKRWLLITNKSTMEEVENDFPKVIKDLKYHFFREKLVREHDLKVENDDIDALARQVVRSQFAQYGMMSVPDDMLENYVKDMLKNEKTVDDLADRVLDEKLTVLIGTLITIDEQEVTVDKFNEIIKEQK